MKNKRNFDYMEFCEDYGTIFDAEKYTVEQALNIMREEYGYENVPDIDFEVYEIKLRWFPKMNRDEMWYYDVYDSSDNRGIYRVVEDENINNDPNNRGFRCWRIRYDKAHEEVRNASSL